MTVTDGIVSLDVPCTTCGYNLRTLPADALCSECGSTIKSSLETTLMRWGPRYLRQIARASAFAAWLNAAAIGITLTFILGAFIVALAFPHFNRGEGLYVVLFAAYLVITILHVWAAWLVTRPPMGGSMPGLAVAIRVASILFSFAMVVPLLFILLIVIRGNIFVGQGEELYLKLLAASWTLLLPSLSIFAICSGRHFAALCKNAGIHSLAGWHRGVSRFLATGATLMNVGFFAAALVLLEIIRLSGRNEEWFIISVALSVYGGLLITFIALLALTVLL